MDAAEALAAEALAAKALAAGAFAAGEGRARLGAGGSSRSSRSIAFARA